MLEHPTTHLTTTVESGETCDDKSSQHSVTALRHQSADNHFDKDVEHCESDQEGDDEDDEDVEDEEIPTDDVPYPGFEEVVFKCLPQTHRLRRLCLHLITSPWFERLVILIILLNCLTLGMYQPCKDASGCTDTRCTVLGVFDHVIYAFFLIEMVIKLTAMGFLGKKGYWAEAWNRLDMIIIIAGTADVIIEAAAEYGIQNGEINLSSIRTIRVLRPLRAINRIPNLRILVMLLLDTLPMLGNVLLISFFVFFIFGILGVQLWAGMLRQRCYMPEDMTNLIQNISDTYNRTNNINPYYEGSWSSLEFICSLSDGGGMLRCSDIENMTKDGLACTEPFTPGLLAPNYVPPKNGSCVDYNQYYTECRADGPNPFEQSISFDNIASAWIAIFQVISLEGWVDIMYYIQDVHSYWVWIYFLALIVIGSFFMVNLFLVVIATQFSETKRRETKKIAEERKRYKSSTTLTSTKTESDGCYNQLLKYIIHLVRRTHRRVVRAYQERREARNNKTADMAENSNSAAGVKLNVFGNHIHCQPCYHVTALVVNFNPPIASPEPSDIDSVSYSARSRQLANSPRFYRPGCRAGMQEPVIVISSEQDETSFNTASQNGGLKVVVDANEGPDNSAILQVLQSQKLSPNGRKCSSVQHSPQLSPNLAYRHDRSGSNSPRSLCETSSERHQPLWRSLSQGAKLVTAGNHLAVPNTTKPALPSPSLSAHRLRVPGDVGSTRSIQSHGSSASPQSHTALSRKSSGISNNGHNHQKPALTDNHRFSFSQLSYMQGGCDLCCPQCQHLCIEYQNQERLRIRKETREATVRHQVAAAPENEKLRRFRAKLKVIVNGNVFRNGILISILINTVMMGIEHHKQPHALTLIVEYSNYVFIGIFTLEMILKLAAEGALHYIKDAFNVFDGFVVIMSYVEIGMGSENSGLSVLRTFRLLRILKLIRFLPALQRQFTVMVRTLDNVASFFGLLMLFMFIFSVLGMNLFGCLFWEEVDGVKIYSRRNFDSLLWSLLTVFQILTQEDWNLILYEGMSKTSPWAALYFIALMTIGNYVLFNLLVAILVEGFSSVAQKRLDNFLRKRGQKMSRDRGEVPQISVCGADDEDDRLNMCQEDRAVTGGALPSIITDHADVNGIDGRLPPIITHTDATPRGSPKSESNLPSPNLLPSENQQLDCDSHSMLLGNSCIHSPSSGGRKSTNSTPKLHRKNSSGSRSSRHPRSEDKVSLMESALDDEDDIFSTSRQTTSSTGNRSRNSSIRNFDLLQVPGREALNSTSSDAAISVVNFDMDESVSNSNQLDIMVNSNKSLGSLSVQIPEQHITPPELNANCNGNANHHPPLARMNGGPRRHTTVGVSSTQHPKNGSAAPKEQERKESSIFKRTPSGNSLDLETDYRFKVERKNSRGSLYSRLNETDEMEKQFPYSDQQKFDDGIKNVDEKQKRSLYKKLIHACRPRGCLVTRADYSLYVFSPTNRLKRFCKWLSSRKWFDYIILVLIGLNCITLAVERPSIPVDSTERHVLTVSNYCFTALFLFEMIIKVTAKGFVIGPDTYLRDGWNVNDGFLVLVSCIDVCITLSLAESPKIFGVLRVLRLLRALRPLRVISRAPGLKLVVETLLSSLRPIGNIVLICLTFFLIFGILGVQLFRGSFYHCVGEDLRNITDKADCLRRNYQWENWKYNFDNLGNALMSLFVLSSKDGWVMIMYQGLDAVGEDMQPIENYNEWRLLYFISFLLLVGFFVLNMFVGVVVENFHRCREAHEKEEREKREQRKLKKLTKKLANPKSGINGIVSASIVCRAEDKVLQGGYSNDEDEDEDDVNDLKQANELNQEPYYMRYSRTRHRIYRLVTNKFFDIAVSIIIFLNVISMAVEHYQMSKEMLFALKIMNYVFTFIFILEALFKILAFGFVRYIKERWNQLDMLIVVLSLVGIALEEVQTDVIPINPTIMRVMRILRIARVLKLLKVAKGIRALLDTVLVALPQVGNLGLLFFLLFFIFASLGVELFGRIECSSQNPCEGMGVHANFENSGSAFLTLFRIATGDNWNGIMKDALRENCDSSVECERNCCVNTVITPIYFVVFVLTAQFVLVNVVVAVLMKHLEEATLFDGGSYLPKNDATQTNASNDSEDSNNNKSLLEDDKEETEFNVESTPIIKPDHNMKQCKSHSLLPQHKPLSKHLSLPSNFKIHPTTASSTDETADGT